MKSEYYSVILLAQFIAWLFLITGSIYVIKTWLGMPVGEIVYITLMWFLFYKYIVDA